MPHDGNGGGFSEPAIIRTIVYVDGFNLYFGIRSIARNKWLDIKKLCELLLNNSKRKHCIIGIKYFTARVKNHPRNPDVHLGQETYLRAIRAHCGAEIVFGKFARRKKRVKLVNPIGDIQWAEAYVMEEKGSDVNLAVHMVNDCFTKEKECDCAVLISNDSDLALALEVVKENNKSIGLLTPNSRPGRKKSSP